VFYNPRRVLIADDPALLAEVIRSVLEKKYNVVGIIGDSRQLLIKAPKLKAGFIALEIGVPSLKGLVASLLRKSQQ